LGLSGALTAAQRRQDGAQVLSEEVHLAAHILAHQALAFAVEDLDVRIDRSRAGDRRHLARLGAALFESPQRNRQLLKVRIACGLLIAIAIDMFILLGLADLCDEVLVHRHLELGRQRDLRRDDSLYLERGTRRLAHFVGA